MRQVTTIMEIATPGQGLHDVTPMLRDWLRDMAVESGLLTVFCRHTSASLLIQENAAPAARRDLERWFHYLAPEGDGYEHDEEGPDDMPAHLRAAVTATSLAIPVIGGSLALGTWQGVYLFEHRRAPHRRTLALHLLGD
jgi:secondary thiamine-phosphate synthase enzyme